MSPISEAEHFGQYSLETFRDGWISSAVSTVPVDRIRAEVTIDAAYSLAGLDKPKRYLWVSSPMGALVALGALRVLKWDGVGDGDRKRVNKAVFEDFITEFAGQLPETANRNVTAVLNGVRERISAGLHIRIRAQIIDDLNRPSYVSGTDRIRNALGDAVFGRMLAEIRSQVDVRRLEDVGAEADDHVEALAVDLLHRKWGWDDDYWMAYCDVFAKAPWKRFTDRTLRRFTSLAEAKRAVPVFFPFPGIVVCCESPRTLETDDRGRLHRADGAALMYRDGWGIWAWRGARVPRMIVEHPEKLSAQRVEAEINVEVRRVMIERMGWERYIREAGLKPVQSDDWGTLYRKELSGDPEPLTLVRVTNSTPEPDGGHKDYILRVHHECRPLLGDGILGVPQRPTALNAIASTFGLTGEEYRKILVQT